MGNKKIQFEVGIIPGDEMKLKDFINSLIEDDVDEKFHMRIINEFDDPDGYYTYLLEGSWDSYQCIMGQKFVKSISHYEE